MSDFTSILNQRDLFQVEVEFRPIVGLLNYLNEELKSLGKRITSLESVSKTHVLLEDHESAIKTMDERVTSVEERLNSISTTISCISTDVKNIESKTNLTIDERMNDILVSTNMNIKHSANTIDAQVRQNCEMLKTLKQEIDNLSSPKDEPNLKTLNENVKKNTNEIKVLKKKIAELTSDEDIISQYKNGDPNNNGIELKMKENINSALNQFDQQKEDIGKLTSEINEIKERLSIAEGVLMQKDDDAISISSISSSTTQPKNLDIDDLSRFNEDLLNFKNQFDDHQSKVVSAMKAIQFELQQIRDNGQGLLDLPPLNLYNVVPSFFNEDKKILSLSDSESAPVLELAENPTEEEDEEKKKEKEPKRNFKKEVERMKYYNIQPILRNKKNEEDTTNQTKCVVIKTDDSPPRHSPIERPAPNSNIDVNQIIRQIKNELNMNEIQNSFKQFKKDHDEIINSIERKVDREYVERLFDKFRIIVHGMNDRVKELASLTADYATKEDFKLVVQIVKNLPKDGKSGTAVKRGPTCLFCGRPKTSIAGEISPRTAAMAGSAPVSNVGSKDGDTSCEFVYGDGQAYYKRDENFQSFPHFDVLPPLPANDSDNEKSVSKTTAEINGRVSLTRNGERSKTSLSMPNSRVSKSRK
ncbi:hypothetical protein M9Y10_009382 [Tritrichomonas musculus]|uniref:Uncharacterized protein n=1 Tax=Tritrichomonas musculus TaxID=1915356 RepID=A0ABR2IN71_9EUKA